MYLKTNCCCLTPGNIDGKPAEYDENGVLIHPAQIGCTLSSLIEKLEPGQPVWIDDGKLGAIVEAVTGQGRVVTRNRGKSRWRSHTKRQRH